MEISQTPIGCEENQIYVWLLRNNYGKPIQAIYTRIPYNKMFTKSFLRVYPHLKREAAFQISFFFWDSEIV